MTDNQNWIQIKVTCKVADLDTVTSVMSMVDNGLMIEDYSDVDRELDGVYGDLIDETILEILAVKSAGRRLLGVLMPMHADKIRVSQRRLDVIEVGLSAFLLIFHADERPVQHSVVQCAKVKLADEDRFVDTFRKTEILQ